VSDPLKPLFGGPGSALESLARRAAATSALTDSVRGLLPEALRPHVISAVRRDDDLVVLVDSAAWSARVRYAGQRLCEQLDALGERVNGRVRVRVGRPSGRGGGGDV
jgi:hypothetical protein